MLLAIFLIVLGLAGCVYGVLLATGMRRPMDLLGALLAAAGLALAMLGAGRLLSERFFSAAELFVDPILQTRNVDLVTVPTAIDENGGRSADLQAACLGLVPLHVRADLIRPDVTVPAREVETKLFGEALQHGRRQVV